MGFDLSHIDAELTALGEVPADLDASRTALAGLDLSSLSAVDAALTALGEPADAASFKLAVKALPVFSTDEVEETQEPSEAAASVDEARPKSGEIALGEPVRRREPPPPQSGELSLDADPPRSGAFELPSEIEDDALHEMAPADDGQPPLLADVTPISFQAPASMGNAPEPTREELDASIDDALSLLSDDDFEADFEADLGPALSGEPITTDDAVPDEPTSLDMAAEVRDALERDPDAEFDALFDDATNPSGIPTRPEEDDLNVDALLDGLRGPTDPPRQTEADAATRALLGELEGESTDIIDSSRFQASLDPFPEEEELGSSEFEILLGDEGTASDIVPAMGTTKKPTSNKPGTPEKRPSFLGRLFGRKEGDE
jgi:hypothetical protein